MIRGICLQKKNGGWVFLLGALIIIIALLSVSIQTWKAAKQSPALALQNL
jgi:hypothetical protein